MSLPWLVILFIYSSADSWLSCQNVIVPARRKINDFTIKVHYNILIFIDSIMLYYLTSQWRIVTISYISKLTLYISIAITSEGILLLPWNLSHSDGQLLPRSNKYTVDLICQISSASHVHFDSDFETLFEFMFSRLGKICEWWEKCHYCGDLEHIE